MIKPKVTTLSQLEGDIAPMRDLWPQIEAGLQPARVAPLHSRWWAAAAVVATLAVGVWLGRNLLPGANVSTPQSPKTARDVLSAAYVTNPAYLKERAALTATFEANLRSLPPETREKVGESLLAIRKSMDEIHAALGREPGNALLQEMLVNSYQDEMRVLVAVHEAGDAGKEI